jgi:DNA-binding response OmpR family regulator
MPRVLIVDDDPSVCRIVAEGLQDHGMDYDEAHDGETALRLLCRATADGTLYDAVILDIVMPFLDGWQVLEAIKANPLWSRLRLIVLTGKATYPEDMARVAEYNAIFVEKNGGFPHLLEAIVSRLVEA